MASIMRVGTALFFIAESINSMLSAVQKHLITLSKCFRMNDSKRPRVVNIMKVAQAKPLKPLNCSMAKCFHHHPDVQWYETRNHEVSVTSLALGVHASGVALTP